MAAFQPEIRRIGNVVNSTLSAENEMEYNKNRKGKEEK